MPRWGSLVIYFSLAICLLLGTYARFNNFENRLLWWGDISRDLLVSNHMWQYGERISIGHAASGLHQGLCSIQNYPAYYYNYLSLLWSITQSYIGVIEITAFVGILGVIFSYLLVSSLHNRCSGLIAAILFAVSQRFIENGRIIVGLQVSISYVILGSFFVVHSLKKRIRWLNALGMVFLIFLSTFHYSILVIVASFFVISEVFFAERNLLRYVKNSFVMGIIYGIFFLLIHSSLIEACGGAVQFLSMFVGGNAGSQVQFRQGVPLLVTRHLEDLFPAYTFTTVYLIVACTVISLVLSKKSRVSIIGMLGMVILFLLASVGATSQDIGMQALQTLFIQYILFFMSCISISFAWIESMKRKWYPLTFGVMVVFLVTLFSVSNKLAVLDGAPTNYSESELANSLLNQPLRPFTFTFYRSGMYDYDSVVIAFWLEQQSSQKIYKIINGFNNYTPIEQSPRYKFFLCDQYSYGFSSGECQKMFETFRNENKEYQETPLQPFDFDRYDVRVLKKIVE